MNFTDLLTISMPVYERKEFFLEALESALNQTVKCKIIVNDNCSSHDFFEKVCKEKNVDYYRNEKNIGMPANFAMGYERAKTPYAMNLQDDDILLPDYVETFVKAVNQHPDIDVFFTDTVRLTLKGELPHRHIIPFGYMENGKKVIEYGVNYHLGFPYIASVLRREKAHRITDAYEWDGSWDWEWVYTNADNLVFYGEPRKLYKFREHINQDTKNNAMIYRLTMPFIYDTILKGKVGENGLKSKASKNAFWELINLKAFTEKKILHQYINGSSKYNRYLKSKLTGNLMLKVIFVLPQPLVKYTYKLIRKTITIR